MFKHKHVKPDGVALIQVVQHCTEAQHPQQVYLVEITAQRVQLRP